MLGTGLLQEPHPCRIMNLMAHELVHKIEKSVEVCGLWTSLSMPILFVMAAAGHLEGLLAVVRDAGEGQEHIERLLGDLSESL